MSLFTVGNKIDLQVGWN